jgi:hypothetical protein
VSRVLDFMVIILRTIWGKGALLDTPGGYALLSGYRRPGEEERSAKGLSGLYGLIWASGLGYGLNVALVCVAVVRTVLPTHTLRSSRRVRCLVAYPAIRPDIPCRVWRWHVVKAT